jgi:hypothetical protein
METCHNCGVRFKRDIFKECPGCGLIKLAWFVWPVAKTLSQHVLNRTLVEMQIGAQRGVLGGLRAQQSNIMQPSGLGAPFGGLLLGGLMQAQPHCPYCGR